MERFKKAVQIEETAEKYKYFIKISAEDREKVKIWLEGQVAKTEREKSFLKIVKKAIKEINYDYWIATIEPSVNDGKLYYAKGHNVARGFSGDEWRIMAKKYDTRRKSRMSKITELFMWYAVRIVNGMWSLDYVANDSSSAGNYLNSPNSSMKIEKSGARECGGFSDGQGNTYKLVTSQGCYALIGGFCKSDGSKTPVAEIYYDYYAEDSLGDNSAVLVLTK